MLKVDEDARITTGPLASRHGDGPYGAFLVWSPEPGWQLRLIVAGADEPVAEGWEHVSVSALRPHTGKTRTPTWKEMAYVKRLHWDDDDVVIQFHPRLSDYVNVHPHVLHLWRDTRGTRTPPAVLVGDKRQNVAAPEAVEA